MSSSPPPKTVALSLPRWRTVLLRLTYAFIAFGLIATLWQEVATAGPDIELQRSVVLAMLSTMALLCIVGIFRPIAMLPILLFEFVWKVIWLAVFYFRFWNGSNDAGADSTFFACALGVVLCAIAIPWRYWFMQLFPSHRAGA